MDQAQNDLHITVISAKLVTRLSNHHTVYKYVSQICQSNMSVISVSQSVSQSVILDPYKTQDSISLLMNKHFQGLFIKGRKAWGGYTDIIIRSYLFLVLYFYFSYFYSLNIFSIVSKSEYKQGLYCISSLVSHTAIVSSRNTMTQKILCGKTTSSLPILAFPSD